MKKGSLPRNFCPAPFFHTYIGPKMEHALCCVSQPIGTIDPSLKTPLLSSWSSDKLKEIRTQFLNNKFPEECYICQKNENNGLTSRRMGWLEYIKDKNINLEYDINYGNQYKQPIDLYISPSNVCNLKCRMCNPNDSHLIDKEVKNNQQLQKYYDKTTNNLTIDWMVNENVFDDVKSIMPNLSHIKISGGEPTLSLGVMKFLKHCIDNNHHKNISLQLNTNGSNISEKFIDAISKFKSTSIKISIDGTGDTYDYIRTGGDFNILEKNVYSLLSTNINIFIHTTVQIYNIFNIVDMLKWGHRLHLKGFEYNKKIMHIFHPVFKPKHFDISYLPLDVKMKIKNNIIKEIRQIDYEYIEQSEINNIISSLDIHRTDEECKEQNKKFIDHTHLLDTIRKTNLNDMLPQLNDIFSVY